IVKIQIRVETPQFFSGTAHELVSIEIRIPSRLEAQFPTASTIPQPSLRTQGNLKERIYRECEFVEENAMLSQPVARPVSMFRRPMPAANEMLDSVESAFSR